MHKNIRNFIEKNGEKIELGVKIGSGVAIAAAFGVFAGRFMLQHPSIIIDEDAVDKMYRIQHNG